MVPSPLRLYLPTPPDPLPSPIQALLAALRAVPSSPTALNFYDESASQAAGDLPGAATARQANLTAYLVDRWAAPILLIGEAPGYQGARHSGIAFTSQFQLTGAGWKEPSATIVHKALAALDHERDVLLWNATTLHPRRSPDLPDTNRRPTPTELNQASAALALVSAGRTIVAVGRVASELTGAPYVRHPANGGATAFAAGLAEFLSANIPTTSPHVSDTPSAPA